MSKILIFDGNNLAHRCKHSYSLSYRGEDVSILYGVIRVILSVMKKHEPDAVVVAWDNGIPKFRQERVPSYKAHRHERTPDDAEYYSEVFIPQVEELEDVLPLLGVVSVRRPFCEADDAMAMAARLFSGDKVVITTDQDLYQLVRHDVVVWSPVKDIIVDRAYVTEMIGADPMWWTTYRSMVGDGSDGIPGIQGIGPKGAVKIMEATDGLSSTLFSRAKSHDLPVSEKLCDRIIEAGMGHFNDVHAVSDLWQDRCGACRTVLMAVAQWQPYDGKEIAEFLRFYGFSSFQDPTFYRTFKRLRDPTPLLRDYSGITLRMPAIAPPRRPVERQ